MINVFLGPASRILADLVPRLRRTAGVGRTVRVLGVRQRLGVGVGQGALARVVREVVRAELLGRRGRGMWNMDSEIKEKGYRSVEN